MLNPEALILGDTMQFLLLEAEISLIAIVLACQTLAVFYPGRSRCVGAVTIWALVVMLAYLIIRIVAFTNQGAPSIILGFGESFVGGPMIMIFKSLILGMVIMTLILYQSHTKISGLEFKFEFFTLILLSTLGIFISISARDFLLLFCGLELQALSGYALASFNSHEYKSSEAGLKYFILGALMSCLMLFGISFLYGFSGSLNYIQIGEDLVGSSTTIGLIIGAVLVLASILFKLSSAPMHVWTPDVYEGAPIASVSYFAVAQKVGMLVVLINIVNLVMFDIPQISVELIKIVAVLSMIVGALGAIMQVSLKRLMAYSTILNVGYVLVGIVLHSFIGMYAAFLYMFIYAIGVMGFFACLTALFGSRSDEATLNDLKGIAASRKTLSASIAILMFSMIGLPPLAGFFGKYYVFYNAVQQGELALALTGVLTSVIAAFYYLKVIRYMYFASSDDAELETIPTNKGLLFVSTISVSFTIFFFMFASTYLI
jgi:NADH-quinone oxidoreductase subunit N